MTRKAFLFADSLVCTAVVSALALLCLSVYQLRENHQDLKESYEERMEERLEMIFHGIPPCERCGFEDEQP